MALEKLLETVKVDTFLQRLRCPNPDCTGLLENDGGQRQKDGMHGGALEYRHKCSACAAGMWITGDKYPRVRYELSTELEEVED